MRFAGDETYPINCTGDCRIGDEVCFSRSIFAGDFRLHRHTGYQTVHAKIVNATNQSFTIEISGKKTVITKKNLQWNGVWRKLRIGESSRACVGHDEVSYF